MSKSSGGKGNDEDKAQKNKFPKTKSYLWIKIERRRKS
jgi:hypothetical protein